MKQKIIKIVSLSTFLILILMNMVLAQGGSTTKTDRIIFLDGHTKEGMVTALVNDKIRFTHRGETLSYEFTKKEIERIEYASGRTELLTVKREIEDIDQPVNTKNRVAVLPLNYIADGNLSKMENMPFLLQQMTIGFLSKSAAELKFVDPSEINVLLLRAGIHESNMREYTPKELARLLRVEYVIMGTVMQDRGKIVTVNHHRTQSRKNTDRDWDGHNTKERRESHGSTVTGQQIENQVSLSIYNNRGENIYSRSRHSLIANTDGYQNTLRYLLKRTPLYER